MNKGSANTLLAQNLSLIPGTQQKKKVDDGIQMLPSTPKAFKRTKRYSFARRMSTMDKPIIIITFQGILGDFFKVRDEDLPKDPSKDKNNTSQYHQDKLK